MTQPDTGPLCRYCKHSVREYEMTWCDFYRETSGFNVRTSYERVHGLCGPTGKNFEAKP